ncbi:uncharacterized protein LOC141857066 [Brevipalpus obovatus]|uniref:uncharacterized protein LOC141857066 n=1 Tax=Brevipalpus obovatus TaxID=246614 RepID=UPI003D9F9AB2
MNVRKPTELPKFGSDDPFKIRRKMILAKHPEIKSLMKVDPLFKWQVLALVFIQIVTVFLLRNVTNWLVLLPIGYLITGVISHACGMAIHEINHGQAFGPTRIHANAIFAMIANLPMIFPAALFHKKHHFKHHRYFGQYTVDLDIPSEWERKISRTPLAKVKWLLISPFLTLSRYSNTESKNSLLETYGVCNYVSQLVFCAMVIYYCGTRMLIFLIISVFLATNFHPVMGHRLTNHLYLFKSKDLLIKKENSTESLGPTNLETYSYYGLWNKFTFNAGYHVEHHDFPSIPGSKLPLVRAIAPEFYENLPFYTSWEKTIWNFVFDPSFGPWSYSSESSKEIKHESHPIVEKIVAKDLHALRRKQILAKHPEIGDLIGHDPLFKWQVLFLVLFQIVTLILLRNVHNWLVLLLIGYFITGVINHALYIAIHEISHGQAFGSNRVHANLIFGLIANLPLILPISVEYKRHHSGHHQYLGKIKMDLDAPSDFERRVFKTPLTKTVWLMINVIFAAFRHADSKPLGPKFTAYYILNITTQIICNFIIAYFCGLRMILFLAISWLLVIDFHPLIFQRIANHFYLFKSEDLRKLREKRGSSGVEEQMESLESFSYYGLFNKLTFNTGYHVEHHDFPSIPCSKLPLVRKIAPEFYDNLPHYTSWTKVVRNFITDPSFGPWSYGEKMNNDSSTSCWS